MPRTEVARGVGYNGQTRTSLPTGGCEQGVLHVGASLSRRGRLSSRSEVVRRPALWRFDFSFRPRSQTAFSPFDPRFARISATLRMTRTKGSGMRAYRYPVGGDVPGAPLYGVSPHIGVFGVVTIFTRTIFVSFRASQEGRAERISKTFRVLLRCLHRLLCGRR